jgi:muramoyltetrapeptide carboxypeptidase
MRIAIVAPSCPLKPEAAERVQSIVAKRGDCELWIHPQSFLVDGHFAGPDEARLAALSEVMADASVDAVWFARGGYGSNRIAEAALAQLPGPAGDKTYLGYSDAGFLLAGLYKAGLTRLAHGPMPADMARRGGEAAVRRALAFLVDGAAAALEPAVSPERPAAAFNIVVLGHLIGTPLEPDLAGHVLMLEEVSEAMYRIDRTLFQITSDPALRRVAGIRLGRCSDIPANVPEFGQSEEEVVRHWCAVSGIPYLGRADIGHDVDNKVVPFGRWSPAG